MTKKTKNEIEISKTESVESKSYLKTFEALKEDILQTQLKAAASITRELILLYWRTGKVLAEKIKVEGWGSKTIERLARDIKREFPDLSGFSQRNLTYMRQFAESSADGIYATVAAQIPWGHNLLILDKVSDQDQRIWYIHQTLENGWSRSMLETWIESDLYGRQGKALTNFKKTLPSPHSDLAEQTIKDPYNLSFLVMDTKFRENELEQGLMDHLQKFLIELGDGFAFLGRQYKIEIAGEDHKIDLLFFHVNLNCYVVIELKATDFDPRDAGQMNFYLSAVDDLLKKPGHNPSIGMLLCKKKNKVKVEYALRRSLSPISVASYETKIMKSLPKEFASSLPTIEEIEKELSDGK